MVKKVGNWSVDIEQVFKFWYPASYFKQEDNRMKYLMGVAILVFFLTSCREDRTNYFKESLNGHYDFVKAYRGEKETKTLQSGYFFFDRDNMKFYSNLIDEGNPIAYNIENSRLKLASEDPITLNITDLNDAGELKMKGVMQGFRMEFHLIKNDTIHLHHK